MKIFFRMMFCMFLFLCLSCADSPKEVLLDSFEGKITSETVDYGTAEGSSLSVEADTDFKVCGEQSLKIAYDLKPSGYMWIARGYGLDVKGAASWNAEPLEIKWAKYNALSVYMYGGNKGGVVAFDIKDSGGELWRFLLDDDFTGWKEFVCPFSEFFPRGDWQPEDAFSNEVIDFPVLSFQFEPRLPGEGEYRFDCVKLVKVKK